MPGGHLAAKRTKRPASGERNERWARSAPSATIERPGRDGTSPKASGSRAGCLHSMNAEGGHANCKRRIEDAVLREDHPLRPAAGGGKVLCHPRRSQDRPRGEPGGKQRGDGATQRAQCPAQADAADQRQLQRSGRRPVRDFDPRAAGGRSAGREGGTKRAAAHCPRPRAQGAGCAEVYCDHRMSERQVASPPDYQRRADAGRAARRLGNAGPPDGIHPGR